MLVVPKENAFQQVGVNLFLRWNDETIVMIGLLYSGRYPGGAVWKVDKEGAEKGTTHLPHLHGHGHQSISKLVQGNGLALGGGGQPLGGCLQNKLHSRLDYSKLQSNFRNNLFVHIFVFV